MVAGFEDGKGGHWSWVWLPPHCQSPQEERCPEDTLKLAAGWSLGCSSVRDTSRFKLPTWWLQPSGMNTGSPMRHELHRWGTWGLAG